MKKLPKTAVGSIVLAILVVGMLLLILVPRIQASSGPETFLAVTPPMHIGTKVGELFQEDINISTPIEVNSIDFTLTYNASLLDVATVSQGSFFPPNFPPTHFTYVKNTTAGSLTVHLSLLDPQTKSGNGTLVTVNFNVTTDPHTIAFTPILLEQIVILNFAHQPIDYNTLVAIYFWQYTTLPPPPPPPQPARAVDLYTQRAGVGPNASGGEFAAGELVILMAKATYNNYPVQNLSVAFQVVNAQGGIIAILANMTDENGIAQTEFRIRFSSSSEGYWMVIATVDIDCHIVWDTTTFFVYAPSVVGGYTVKTRQTDAPWIPYFTCIAFFASVITLTKHKLCRKTERGITTEIRFHSSSQADSGRFPTFH